jgi:hypothetical protein
VALGWEGMAEGFVQLISGIMGGSSVLMVFCLDFLAGLEEY